MHDLATNCLSRTGHDVVLMLVEDARRRSRLSQPLTSWKKGTSRLEDPSRRGCFEGSNLACEPEIGEIGRSKFDHVFQSGDKGRLNFNQTLSAGGRGRLKLKQPLSAEDKGRLKLKQTLVGRGTSAIESQSAFVSRERSAIEP